MRTGSIATARDGQAAQGGLRSRLALLGALVIAAALAVATAAPAQDGAGPGRMGTPMSFADLAEQVSPSVVNITTATLVGSRLDGRPGSPTNPFDDFFRDFLDRGPDEPPAPNQRRSQGLGSGFVISADGLIVTNNHVIEGADEITVEFFDGRTMQATLVGTDPLTDIAVLRVEPGGELSFVEFGDSDAARVGDWVIAMGNPLGQGFSLSAGIISARGRALQGNYDDYIQTDAAINRGNSGGPLFNMAGEVIGVNTAILSPTGGSIGIGFAMSSNVVRGVVEQLTEFGETRRGWLGVRIQDLSSEIAESLELASTRGALVTEVMPGPAREAGILSGDVILTFDGRSIANTRDLVRRVGAAAVGRAVEVVVYRNGAEETLTVTLGRREDAEGTARAPGAGDDDDKDDEVTGPMFGMSLSDITDELRSEYALTPRATGILVITVDPDSEGARRGFRTGDVIEVIDQEPVTSVADFAERVAAAREAGRASVLVLLRRGAEPRFVPLTITD